jgi:hypothetical protein
MSPTDLAALLERLAPDLEALAGPWAIFGSAALLMQGAPIGEVPDLDVLTGGADAARLEAAWSAWRACDYTPDPAAPFRSRFSRYALPEGAVEVMGHLEIRDAGGWSAVVVDEVVEVPFAGRAWPVASVAAQVRILRRFGRPKDLEKLARLASWTLPSEPNQRSVE